VDLAGSERLCSEGSVRLDASLAALGNLVQALATQKSYDYLPYRESKLTHLLKVRNRFLILKLHDSKFKLFV
jgi:Kinesin motor domain